MIKEKTALKELKEIFKSDSSPLAIFTENSIC